MDKEPIRSRLVKLEQLKQELPDTKLHDFIDIFIKAKRTHALATIYHRLYPDKLNRDVSVVLREADVEGSLDSTLKLVNKNITKRLNRLWNGAKYD